MKRRTDKPWLRKDALPCPKCGRQVSFFPQSGGLGTGDITIYFVQCKCGLKVRDLGSKLSGAMQGAVRHWNRLVRSGVISAGTAK